jgi:hypothetical protein
MLIDLGTFDAMAKQFAINYPTFCNIYEWFMANVHTHKPLKGPVEMTERHCYSNSAEVALGNPSIGYVEGFGCKDEYCFMHAWNVIGEVHLDYTLRKPEEYRYMGVIIPTELVKVAVGSKHWMISEGVLSTLVKLVPVTEGLDAKIRAALGGGKWEYKYVKLDDDYEILQHGAH